MSDLSNIKSILVLQAGTDPVKVEAMRVQMIAGANAHKIMAWWVVIIGAVLTLTLIGGFVGIPAMMMGFFMMYRTRKLVQNIDTASREYLASLQSEGRGV